MNKKLIFQKQTTKQFQEEIMLGWLDEKNVVTIPGGKV
jgi:hypothetical protein